MSTDKNLQSSESPQSSAPQQTQVGHQVLVPVSLGELLDKITILQIKSERILVESKLVNIRNELQALLQTCAAQKIKVGHPLVLELRGVNEKLWKIEDDIRDLERAKNFGPEFVALARAVYVTNDLRFELKSKINKAMGSAFSEEKSYQQY